MDALRRRIYYVRLDASLELDDAGTRNIRVLPNSAVVHSLQTHNFPPTGILRCRAYGFGFLLEASRDHSRDAEPNTHALFLPSSVAALFL